MFNNLYSKLQPGVDKEAKSRIKQLVKHFVPDLFFAPRGELSDDDGDVNEGMLTGRPPCHFETGSFFFNIKALRGNRFFHVFKLKLKYNVSKYNYFRDGY